MAPAMAGAFVAVLFFACSQGGGSTRACTPGQQESCACTGTSTGVQVCASDGSGYGACTGCPGSGSSSGGGSGSSSGGSSGSGSGSGSGSSSGSSGGDGGSDGGGVNCSTPEVVEAGTTSVRSCGCLECSSGCSNATPCGPAELGTAFCCADPLWPSSGQCHCAGWGCAVMGGECVCSTGSAGAATTCTGSLCCAMGNSSGQCFCFPSDAGSDLQCSLYGANQVPQCDLFRATSSTCTAPTSMQVTSCR
jgi:hypothetical protein